MTTKASMYSPLMVVISLMICRWYPAITAFGNCSSQFLSKSSTNGVSAWIIHFIVDFIAAIIFFVYKWELDRLHITSAFILPFFIVSAYALAIVDLCYCPQRQMEVRLLVLSFVVLIIGFVCRILDVKKMFSTQDSIFQGHSVWHFLTALALYYMYSYQRSEALDKESNLFDF